MNTELQFLIEELNIQKAYLKSLKDKFPDNIITLDRVGYDVYLLSHHVKVLQEYL